LHLPVLEHEVVVWLTASQMEKECKRYVDVTLGGGGHAAALLKAAPHSELLGVDQDEKVLKRAKERLAEFGKRVVFTQGRFSLLSEHLASVGWDRVDGIIADLGVSSFQLDEADRGFSFRREGPLDMRMDTTKEPTAATWIATTEEEEMAHIFFEYGEERFAQRIARHLCVRREQKSFETTVDLAEEIRKALPPSARFPRTKGGKRIHPATRVFQAIRIALNEELQELEHFLHKAPFCLHQSGRCVVISYHSLEDRMVKRAFRALATEGFSLPMRKAQKPQEEEIAHNPRARSAKLRVLERIDA